jgi:hypothetical protein
LANKSRAEWPGARTTARASSTSPPAIRGAADHEILNAGAKAVFAAELFDGGAQALHHGDEPKGADMRLAGDQDLLRRAAADELLQHAAAEMGGVAHAGPELAVGEGAGPALAELHVAFRRQHAAAPQGERVLRALAHHLAAFEDDGPEAHLRERERREQPARPRADHHRPVGQLLRRAGDMAVGHVRRGHHVRVTGEAGQGRRFVGHGHVQRVDQVDGAAPACIVGAAEHVQRKRRLAEAGGGGFVEGGLSVVEGELDFGQAEHGCAYVLF